MPLVFMVGTYTLGAARVGYVEKDSPAEQAGFLVGDIIEKVNGRKVTDWKKAEMQIAVNPDTDIAVVVERTGEKKTLTLRPELDANIKIGVSGLSPDFPTEIGNLVQGFPAEKAGVRVNDKIIAVDGKRAGYWTQFSDMIKQSNGKQIALTIERDGKPASIMVIPVKQEGKYVIGVGPLLRLEFKQYGFLDSLRLGFEKTIEYIDLTFLTLKKLLTLNLSIKTLGGPVMIAQMSGAAAAAGLSTFLDLLAMISISLGILNLLPIPVLDGGLLLFLAIEAVRKKPLSQKVMAVSQNIGAAVLISLIVVVSYNDIMRMFFSK
jgi:regulator of sigma E protease